MSLLPCNCPEGICTHPGSTGCGRRGQRPILDLDTLLAMKKEETVMSGYTLFRRIKGFPDPDAICLVGPDGRIVDDAADVKASWTIHTGDEGEEYHRCTIVVTRKERIEDVRIVDIEEDEPLPSELKSPMTVEGLVAALTVLERAGRGGDVVKIYDYHASEDRPVTGYVFGGGSGIVELQSDE